MRFLGAALPSPASRKVHGGGSEASMKRTTIVAGVFETPSRLKNAVTVD
jgi:hypothetical protein